MFRITVQHNDHTVKVDKDGDTDYKDVIKGLRAAIKQVTGEKINEELRKELESDE